MVSFRKFFELLSSFNCKYLFILKKEHFHLKKKREKKFLDNKFQMLRFDKNEISI